MSQNKVIFSVIVTVIAATLVFQLNFDNKLEIMVDISGPYVGTTFPNDLGYDGEGIKIAVIDTGVDHLHPDLFGFGPGGKIVGGYNFVDESKMPVDTNGHGTEVSGIIAADGQLSGIAPKASIFAYKVSDDGENVSSDLIIKAINKAIEDDVDIINISLGVNKTNSKIDDAVSKATRNGIVVVVAAGNDGPGLETIGSPGQSFDAITVGATYNNITASLVATLEVDGKQFQVMPMMGTSSLDEPITEEIVFGEYGRQKDLSEGSFSDSMVLVERGSSVEGELVYFSEKENNVANVGGRALIVYNNQKGIFLGELFHQFAPPDYRPRIPVLSMSNEDGEFLKNSIQNRTTATLNVFYNPDFVAYFSSRGPVSPFYIKPDLVAPGVFINSTLIDAKYNLTSGTSFAAPHVSGAAALLLQKNQDFTPKEVKSLLVTTTDFVTDAYENKFPIETSGSGRLNITRAFEANLIISPPTLIYNLSTEKETAREDLKLKALDGSLGKINAEFVGDDDVNFDYKQQGNVLETTVSLPSESLGEFQGTIVIENKNVEYHIPVVIHKTKGSVNVFEEDGRLDFEILYPEEWSYAKISVINKDTGKTDVTSVTPKKESSISVTEKGEYWILANIVANGETSDAFETITIETPSTKNNFDLFDFFEIPERPFIIVIVVAVMISLVGLKFRMKSQE
ncbi:MAG: peptidase S8/S53 subtilisin kexin sedolisin [Marine Group I thaumarchaeote]|nr:MAG: peptidase S8/S53 subtilisin kexin sedolisin [Marine Group I thaumarchaeote]